MSNLFDLTSDFLDVLNKLDEGYTVEELQDTLDSIQVDMDTKIDNTVGLIKSVDGDIEIVDKEIKRLQEVKKQKENTTKNLKNYLQTSLDLQNKDNYRTSKNYIYKRKNGASKDVVDESKIPKEYWVSQAPKLNSKMLTDDLKAGKEIPGAQLKQTVSLVVK